MKDECPEFPLDGLPEFLEYKKEDPSFKWPAFLFMNTKIEDLYSISRLFWPAICEHQGGFFLQDWFSQEAFEQWMQSTKNDLTLVEYMMNKRFIHDLVDETLSTPAKHLHHLGRILQECWTARLTKIVSGPFEVSLEFSAEDEECKISFFLKR